MFDRFSERARKSMGLARQEAQRFSHDYIGPEHILFGLCLTDGVGAHILRNLETSLVQLQKTLESKIALGDTMVTMGQIPFTPRGKYVLEQALAEASSLGHSWIGTEHLLIGIIRENESPAAEALREMNVNLPDVREELFELLGEDLGTRAPGGSPGMVPAASTRDWFAARVGHRVEVVLVDGASGTLRGRITRVAGEFVAVALDDDPDPEIQVTFYGIATFRDLEADR